ncbi:hypothetical protein GCM10023149_13450 [Mucilaginibacter gynuensis]|uniref:Transcriptional regulator n=1 Tax=Mucilaginibacter gynuensis TaxID=1302236 RepID=A0ABP8G3Z7_9SPHI
MATEKFEVKEDILTICEQAKTFPAGIQDAYAALSAKTGGFTGRGCYGVTEKVDGRYIYRACVSESYPGEGEKIGADHYTIPKGTYIANKLGNWMENIPRIATVFDELMRHPDVTMDGGIALEYYVGNDVWLMITAK